MLKCPIVERLKDKFKVEIKINEKTYTILLREVEEIKNIDINLKKKNGAYTMCVESDVEIDVEVSF